MKIDIPKPTYGFYKTYYVNEKIMKYTILRCLGDHYKYGSLYRVYEVKCDCGNILNIANTVLRRPILGCDKCL